MRESLSPAEKPHIFDGDLHDLLLIHNRAVGLVEDIGESVIIKHDDSRPFID